MFTIKSWVFSTQTQPTRPLNSLKTPIQISPPLCMSCFPATCRCVLPASQRRPVSFPNSQWCHASQHYPQHPYHHRQPLEMPQDNNAAHSPSGYSSAVGYFRPLHRLPPASSDVLPLQTGFHMKCYLNPIQYHDHVKRGIKTRPWSWISLSFWGWFSYDC